MYVIETPLGRFEGENEKQAKAALRKAKKLDKIAQAKSDADYRIAKLVSEANAYRILSRMPNKMPPGWSLVPPGLINGKKQCYSVELVDRYTFKIYDYASGNVQSVSYCKIPRLVLENGAGEAMAFVYEDAAHGVHAVGVHGCQAVFTRIENLEVADFIQAITGEPALTESVG